MKDFKSNDIVIIQEDNKFLLGIVCEALDHNLYKVWCDTTNDCVYVIGDALHHIDNDDCFTVLRKKKDNCSFAPCTCREKAREILAPFDFSNNYSKLLDWCTKVLEGDFALFPSLQGEYLEAALRVEVRDLLSTANFLFSEDNVCEIADGLMNHFHCSPLNDEFIQEYTLCYAEDNLYVDDFEPSKFTGDDYDPEDL